MEKENYIITDEEMEQNGVGSAPDYIKADPADIKEIFDKLPKLIAEKLNGFIEAVVAKFLDYYNKDETIAAINSKLTEMSAGDMAMYIYDTNEDGIVNSADNGIFEYVQSGAELAGSGVNGKFKATASATYTSFIIGDASYAVKAGEDSEIELTKGVWYSFVLDTSLKTINFKAGGGVSNSKLASATATAAYVYKDRTFYAGDKALKTGTLDIGAATATAAKVLKGYTFYAGNNVVKTGTLETTAAKAYFGASGDTLSGFTVGKTYSVTVVYDNDRTDISLTGCTIIKYYKGPYDYGSKTSYNFIVKATATTITVTNVNTRYANIIALALN